MNTNAKIDQEQPQILAIEQAIIELLRSCDTGPGDLLDIFAVQHEIQRRGIDRNKFNAGVAQLLSRGVISFRGNSLYLTEAGFETLKRDEGGAGHS